MMTAHETEQAAAALIEQFGGITPAAAMRNARSAGERGELVSMLEWERIAQEALRQMPTELMYLA